MANTVKMKQSAVAGKVPTTAQLALGELAVNTTDGKLFLKKNVSGTETIVDVTASVSLDPDLVAIAALSDSGTGFLKKTAANTWSLDTNTYITGNQSISISGDATGTGTTSIALTLANTGVTAGTYKSVTVDAKGRVTGGTNPNTRDGFGITDVPKTDGTGASGTWGISVSGNAATATRATDGQRIVNPGGGAYINSSGAVTGAIKVKLPTAANNSSTMLRFTVKIYEYSTGMSRTIEIGGYNYGGGNWYNWFATQNSQSGGDLTVRFGTDSTSDCVWIGETTTVWQYPQVFVTDVQTGYSNATDAIWGSGWSVSFVTAFDTVEQSTTAYRTLNTGNYNSYAPTLTGGGASGTWGISVSGNAATVSSVTASQIATGLGYTPQPPGIIQMYGGAAAPTGWLLCNGAAISRSTYSALFAVIGTSFGAGDGSTTFNVPNMQDRVPVGAGSSHTLGVAGGSATQTPAGSVSVGSTTLDATQIPSHTHTVSDPGHSHGVSQSVHAHSMNQGPYTGGGNYTPPGADARYANNANTNGNNANISINGAATGITVSATGGGLGHTHTASFTGTAHSVEQPYLGINFIIKT